MTEAEQRRERLRETLAELEAELAASGSLDRELRARLESTVADLRVTLERAEGDAPDDEDHHSVVDHLSDAMRRFEVTHPKLSLALGRVVDALSNLGI